MRTFVVGDRILSIETTVEPPEEQKSIRPVFSRKDGKG
jgi:hypothetical protein